MFVDFNWVKPFLNKTIRWKNNEYIVVGVYVDVYGSECIALRGDVMLKMVHFSKLPEIYKAYKER